MSAALSVPSDWMIRYPSPPPDSPPRNSPPTTPISANEIEGVKEAKVHASADGTITVRMIWRSPAPRNRAEWMRSASTLREDVADARRRAGDRPCVDRDAPAARLDEPADHVENRRLAAARRPHERDELAVHHLERDTGDGRHVAVTVAKRLGEITDDDAGTGHRQDLYFACAFRTNDMSTALA